MDAASLIGLPEPKLLLRQKPTFPSPHRAIRSVPAVNTCEPLEGCPAPASPARADTGGDKTHSDQAIDGAR